MAENAQMDFLPMFAVTEEFISHPKRMSYVIGYEVIPKLHQNLFRALLWQLDFF